MRNNDGAGPSCRPQVIIDLEQETWVLRGGHIFIFHPELEYELDIQDMLYVSLIIVILVSMMDAWVASSSKSRLVHVYVVEMTPADARARQQEDQIELFKKFMQSKSPSSVVIEEIEEPHLVVPKPARKKAKVIPEESKVDKAHGVVGLQEHAVGQVDEVQTAFDVAQSHVDEELEAVEQVDEVHIASDVVVSHIDEFKTVLGVGGLQDEVGPTVGVFNLFKLNLMKPKLMLMRLRKCLEGDECEEYKIKHTFQLEMRLKMHLMKPNIMLMRPIMDGLEDYGPFHSHSEGQFVPDFVEAAVVFEEYLGRLNELDLENHVEETAHWPEVEDINTDLNLGGLGGATTTWPEEVNNVGRSCAPVVEEFSTEANQAGETDNGAGAEKDVNNGGNINLQASQVEGEDDDNAQRAARYQSATGSTSTSKTTKRRKFSPVVDVHNDDDRRQADEADMLEDVANAEVRDVYSEDEGPRHKYSLVVNRPFRTAMLSCGRCGQIGHNRRSCQNDPSAPNNQRSQASAQPSSHGSQEPDTQRDRPPCPTTETTTGSSRAASLSTRVRKAQRCGRRKMND
ncbi:hypothetical protein SASPL_134331 [Salvia splendens]|uniref:CCHC-type domain-containing protein n=1 Tax=Salvia splendens TaxID=180675 RepID=A0A8X8ZIY0_SALSN|nr:hypothetical protein SASPL_134331 [Salvia splendens]